MASPHVESGVGILHAVDHNIKFGKPLVPEDMIRAAVSGAVPKAESHGLAAAVLDGLEGVGIIPVDHHPAPVGDQLGEGAEGVLDVRQVPEKIQVVLFNIQNHCHRGAEGEKRVAVLAGLGDNGVAVTDPVARPQDGQHAADHNGGVPTGGEKDVGAHRGGGGLAVGAGDAQGILVVGHDGPPGLGALKDWNTGLQGRGNLRIIVVDGGGANDAVGSLHTLGQMADGHRNGQGAQMVYRLAFTHVGAGDQDAPPLQDLCQRGHGYPADTYQMGPAAGLDVVLYVLFHGMTPQT